MASRTHLITIAALLSGALATLWLPAGQRSVAAQNAARAVQTEALDLAPVPGAIRWQSGTAAISPQSAGEAAEALAGFAAAGNEHIVMKFDAPVQPGQRAELEAVGVTLLNYLGDNAFFASVNRRHMDAAAAASTRNLRAAIPIELEWKLAPALSRGEVLSWMVVSAPKDVPANGQAAVPDQFDNPTVGVYILFHRDVDLDAQAIPLVRMFGGWVRSTLRTINGLVIELPYQNIAPLAGEDSVMWIEPPLPKLSMTNDSNRARTGADVVQAPPYGLDGTGVKVLVYDGGTARATHVDFGGRVTVRDSSGMHYHSTHVAGTIGGDGTASGGVRKGMAPGVTMESYGYEQEGGLQQGFLYTDPGDIEADYGEAITVYGCDISSNSIGTNTAANGFPCDWEGNYGATGEMIDSIVAGYFGNPFRVVWANGNERSSGACGTTYHTTAPPACAKNHITVGALNSNDDSVTDFTSWGYTDDGRMKPDISGPGCQSNDDGGVTSTDSSSDTAYTSLCGTSMACPTVAGLGALMLQDFRAQYPGDPDPRGSTLKVLLAHTAVDLVTTGPDYQTGYGSVRVQPAIDLLRSGNFFEGSVDQGQTYSFIVIVGPSEGPVKVTLAWDDVPGTPNVNPVLVNDLDLRVFDSSSTQYYPWTLNPASPSSAAVRTQEDHVNNIEQVVIDSPTPGAYLVEVYGYNVPQGPQSFSVAATPTLVNCSSAGNVSFGTAKYNCASTSADVSVIDCDLNTSDLVVDTVTVNVTSDSEPTGESLLLTETAPESAKFTGSISLSTTDSPGVLMIAAGDTLTAEYLDADDGAGGVNVLVTNTATIDCTFPVVSNVQLSDLRPRSVIIEFDTDEPANGVVRYGPNCGALNGEAFESGYKTSHSIQLTGLTDDSNYSFVIDVTDQAANTGTDDNGGSCYDFSTPVVPDFFTEQFTTGIDLADSTVLFKPNGSVDFYRACVEPIVALPTDPSGATALTLTDDGSAEVTLTGGAQVLLYGAAYSSVFVNANGNVTFLAADGDYTETLDEHFGEPRVAPLWDDFNPSTLGTVSYQQFADRLVVTWLDVPEFDTTNSNTFQVELYFNGDIRMSYLTLSGLDAVSGLSEGLGLDPDYAAFDLSESGTCGPFPPTAYDVHYVVLRNTSTTVDFDATDDGQPAPAQMDYIVTSLPASGVLFDPGAGEITSVPYTVVGGGSQVEYVPNLGYDGPDAFDYKANDGGTPPGGGDSNVASVTISVVPTLPEQVHSFPLDTNPGWTTSGKWLFGTPTGSGSFDGDPTSGATGANVYGYNLNGDYINSMPEYTLTSTAIDMTGYTGVELRFQRWLGVDQAALDGASVSASNDGVGWTTVWSNGSTPISDSSWTPVAIDISAVADNQATVYLRWSMGPTDASVTYPGWNIDDIELWGAPPAADLPGDLNGDCVIDLTDLGILLGNYGSTSAAPEDGDLNGDEVVDLTDLGILLGAYGNVCP